MAKTAVRFVCQNCGAEYPKWMGRCSGCGEWNTLVEERVRSSRSKHQPWVEPSGSKAPQAITEVVSTAESRSTTGIAELDRVLGGGIVPGSLGLLGGTRSWQIYPVDAGSCLYSGESGERCSTYQGRNPSVS